MAIDESRIVDAVCEMNPHGNEEGIIDAFGVYLTNHYAEYYNKISYRFEREVAELDPFLLEFSRTLLINSGHVCGFNTFSGIKKSDAWKALIAPMCENKEDEIRGLTAVLNALGWGVWEVVSVTPDKFVVKSKNTYESEGFLKEFKKRSEPGCFLALGVAISFMNIVYGPETINDDIKQNMYYGEESMCRSTGDHYCEFVIRKRE